MSWRLVRCPSWAAVTEEDWTETDNGHVFPTHVFSVADVNDELVPRLCLEKSFELLWTCTGCCIIYGFGFQSLYARLQYDRWFIYRPFGGDSSETQFDTGVVGCWAMQQMNNGCPLSSHCFTFAANQFYPALQFIIWCLLVSLYVCVHQPNVQSYRASIPKTLMGPIWALYSFHVGMWALHGFHKPMVQTPRLCNTQTRSDAF